MKKIKNYCDFYKDLKLHYILHNIHACELYIIV